MNHWIYFLLVLCLTLQAPSLGSTKAKNIPSKDLKTFVKDLELLVPLPSRDRSHTEHQIRQTVPQWEVLDTYSLTLLAEIYRHNQDYRSELRILDLLRIKNPQQKEYQLQHIVAQKQVEYAPSPTPFQRNKFVKKLSELSQKYPKYSQIDWEIFYIYHHFLEWTRGTSFFQKEQEREALELLKKIETESGSSPTLLAFQCEYFYLNQFYSEAKEFCLKSKKASPKNIKTLIYLEYKLADNNEKALLNILKSFDHSVEVLVLVGQLFLKKKKWNLALGYFKKASQINHSNLSVLMGLAETLFSKGEISKALPYYSKACAQHKYKTRGPFEKARSILNIKGQFKQASKYDNAIRACINS